MRCHFSSCHQERNPCPRAAPGLRSPPHNQETPLCPLLCGAECPGEGAREICRALWKRVADRGEAVPSLLQPVTGRERALAGPAGLADPRSRPRLWDSFELRCLLCPSRAFLGWLLPKGQEGALGLLWPLETCPGLSGAPLSRRGPSQRAATSRGDSSLTSPLTLKACPSFSTILVLGLHSG